MIRKYSAVEQHLSAVSTAPQTLQASTAEKAAFLDDVHYFRGLAILFIVASHVICCFTWERAPALERWLSSFFQGGTVLFVFIAGYLFQHLSGKYEYSRYLKNKARNVILPYLVMSTPAILWFTCVVQRWTVGSSFYEQPILWQAARFYLTGEHMGPYWFVPMIVVFYLAAPLFIYLDRHKRGYWLLPAAVCVSLCVTCGAFAANCVHFFSVYLLGMFCSRYRLAVLAVVERWRLLLLGLLVVFTVAQFEWGCWGGAIQLVQKLVLCGLCLDWFRRIDGRRSRWLAALASLSFGIYFVHPYVMFIHEACARGLQRDALRHTLNGALGEGNVLLFCMGLAAVLLTSVALVTLAKWLFGRYSRMIVGC